LLLGGFDVRLSVALCCVWCVPSLCACNICRCGLFVASLFDWVCILRVWSIGLCCL